MSIAFQIPSNRKILVQRLKNIYFGLKNLLSEPLLKTYIVLSTKLQTRIILQGSKAGKQSEKKTYCQINLSKVSLKNKIIKIFWNHY